jgi:hypothetical protein
LDWLLKNVTGWDWMKSCPALAKTIAVLFGALTAILQISVKTLEVVFEVADECFGLRNVAKMAVST